VAHFAELDENGVVKRIVVVSNDDCKDESGNESESIGIAFCQSLLGGTWVQTSYNHNFRKQYAGAGYRYDEAVDIFIAPQPYPSWSLDANHDWQAPSPKPSEGSWEWNEDSLSWDPVDA
jgi:hypothetical protein